MYKPQSLSRSGQIEPLRLDISRMLLSLEGLLKAAPHTEFGSSLAGKTQVKQACFNIIIISIFIVTIIIMIIVTAPVKRISGKLG